MSEQITLLDVCKLPDVQIHSKTAFFKHIVQRQNPDILKLRQNIVKLSYTNKIIGVKGDQVGIISKRLPLKFKQTKIEQAKNSINQFYLQDTGYVCHKNFFVQPLPTVRKNLSQQKQQNKKDEQKYKTLKIQPYYGSVTSLAKINFQPEINQNFSKFANKNIRTRTQSMVRVKMQQKKPNTQDFSIKRQNNRSSRYPERNKKSFSNLLKDIKLNKGDTNQIISPLIHEENTLFKRYQRLRQMEIYQKQNQQKSLISND